MGRGGEATAKQARVIPAFLELLKLSKQYNKSCTHDSRKKLQDVCSPQLTELERCFRGRLRGQINSPRRGNTETAGQKVCGYLAVV